MSTFNPLSQVQDESVGFASSGIAITSKDIAVESGLLPIIHRQDPGMSGGSGNTFVVPWWALALGVGVGAFVLFGGRRE